MNSHSTISREPMRQSTRNQSHGFLQKCLIFLLVTSSLAESVVGDDEILFRKHLINADSEFSAATAIDINSDGQRDIVCGAWWYEAPMWTKHFFREVQQIRGRFDDYSNLPLDVDNDGDLDIVSVNYRSSSLYWCRNPGPQATESIWEQITIDEPGTSETGRLVDIDGDGKLDVLPNGTKTFAAWYETTRHETAANSIDAQGLSEITWLRHALPDELIGHGIGAGDVNGDGRVDVVGPNGWAEAPEDPRGGRWIWHSEFELAKDCGLPILCYDVDGDGDSDLVWGRGHNIGLYWTEQAGEEETDLVFDDSSGIANTSLRTAVSRTKWITHAIDTSWACAHTLMLADIDGDGHDDLVAGKRYLGHDGRDPGENDPLSIHWYRFEQATKTWSGHKISSGGNCGIDLDSECVDLDGDGDLDILAPARSGLHWLENLRINKSDVVATQLEASPAYESHQDLSYWLQGDQRNTLDSALDHGVRRQHVLSQMEQAMGTLPGSVQRVPLETRVTKVEETERYYRLSIMYTADRSADEVDLVPAFLLIPKQSDSSIRDSLPAMLCLHPTHFELGKAQICGLGGKPSRFYAHELANRGYVCLAPDYPGFADYSYDFVKNRSRYASGSMKAIWNNVRAIDLLESLPCVNRDQIGVIGHSLGGHNALFTAAFDQRLRCAVTSCGFNALEDYYGGDLKGWSSDRYMPRIASEFELSPLKMPFDFPEVLAAIAPRPLFVNAPLHDANFQVEGVRKCQTSVEPLYRLLKASEQVRFEYPDAEHDFPAPIREEAYQWLDHSFGKKAN